MSNYSSLFPRNILARFTVKKPKSGGTRHLRKWFGHSEPAKALAEWLTLEDPSERPVVVITFLEYFGKHTPLFIQIPTED